MKVTLRMRVAWAEMWATRALDYTVEWAEAIGAVVGLVLALPFLGVRKLIRLHQVPMERLSDDERSAMEFYHKHKRFPRKAERRHPTT